MARNNIRVSTKEIALIAVFSSLWAVAELAFGPIVGSLSIGSFSLHGSINRLVGWCLMTLLARIGERFGRVTIMASVATLTTRMIRVSTLEGIVVGLGYALGALTFDVLFFLPSLKDSRLMSRTICRYLVYAVSGASASIPYLIYRFMTLGPYVFIITSPSYVWSIFKGTTLSVIGASIGFNISHKVKFLQRIESVRADRGSLVEKGETRR